MGNSEIKGKVFMEKKKRNFQTNNRIVLGFLLAIIVGLMIFYIQSSLNQIREYGEYIVKEQSQAIVGQISSIMHEATGSIELVANKISVEMTGPELENPREKLDEIIDETPFMFIEYINAKGINYLENGEKFNASDRVYYKEGIQGKRGVWINYTPKLSKEPLLNFYTPLYYENKIVGVLTGTLGAKTNIGPLLQLDYRDEEIIGILCDENNKVIAASFDFEGEIYPEDVFEKYNLSAPGQTEFLDRIKNKNNTIFEFEGRKGNAIGCIDYVMNKNWSTIVVIPSYSLSDISKNLVYSSIFTVFGILFLFSMYVIYIIMSIRKEASMGEERYYQMIRGFTEFYHSVYYVNLLTDQAECIRIQDPKAIDFGIKENGTVPYLQTFVNYVIGQAAEEEKEKLAFFMDRFELRHLLWKESNYVMIYKNKSGGYSQISIVRADEKEKEKSEVRYMLLGIRDVTNQLKEKM